MNTRTRVAPPLFHRIFAASACCVLLAGCGGGSHASLPAAIPGHGTSAVASAPATFVFTIPKPSASSAKKRSPKYLSSATASITLQLTATKNHGDASDIFTTVPAALKVVQKFNPANLSQNGSIAGQCGTDPNNAGNFKCTAVFQLPVGDNTITISSWDAAQTGGSCTPALANCLGNKLSQQITTVWTQQGVANGPTGAYAVSLDGIAATISLSGTQPCTAGSIQGVFGSGAGTSAVTINVSFTDPATKTIVAPGQPKISIKDNDGTFHTSSGTITGTGGNANFNINQSTQSFTLTPTAVPLSNVTVIVHGTQADSNGGTGDGLNFTQSHTFTFSASTAPPTSNFLAVIEQNTAQTSGQINFFQTSLGGPGGPDSIAAWPTAPTLTSTNSINESAPDVDNPEAMVFDSGGNLLIANGGQGGAVTSYAPSGDYGNFACVPSGAIATGAALSTTNQTNLRVPDAIAYSHDTVNNNDVVSVANNPGSAAKNVQEFTLTTNYVAGSSFANPGTFGVPLGRPLVNLPTLTVGTFAFGIFDGTNSKFVILGPTGSTSTVTNADPAINNPFAMAWDGVNHQLVIGDNNTPGTVKQGYLSFWTVSNPPAAPVKVNSFRPQPDPDPADDCPSAQPCAGLLVQRIAVAPTTGYMAVAGINGYNSTYGGIEIQLYDSSHVPFSNGVIAYDGANTGALACAAPGGNDPNNDYVFGESGIAVTDLLWLSSTKLMVMLKQPNKIAVQGIYIYDVSQRNAAQTGFWGPFASGSCVQTAIPNGPTRTFFQNVQPLVPLAATFKP